MRRRRGVCRNSLIASAFFYRQDIEKWGTGTTRVKRRCEEQGLPEPVFQERHGEFEVWLPRFRSVDDLVAAGFEERAARVIAHVERHGEVRNQEIQEMLDVSKRTATRILQEFVEGGHLVKTGVGRGVCYLLAKRVRE